MYEDHQKTIGEYARLSPDNLAHVMQFVIVTIRTPLYRVADDLEIAREDGEDAPATLWGWKYKAFHDIAHNAQKTYSYLEHVNAHGGDDETRTLAMISYLADLPGFGLAKAGFVTQLAYGLGGCLDTHNLQRFRIGPSAFKGYKERKTAKARHKLAKRYVSAVYALGGPSTLWDSWCQYVALNQPTTYDDLDHVSRLHCEALGLT